jgi:hypothetical protein
VIVYYAPGEGKGKSTRAAAICRFLDVVEVVTTFNDNEPLERLGVPYKAFLTEGECIKYINSLESVYIICDVDASRLGKLRHPYRLVYRYGRNRSLDYLFAVDPLPNTKLIFPIVSVDWVLTREEAREDLGIPQDEYLTLGVKSTSRPGKVEKKWPNAVMLDKEPAMRWMPAADKVVGAIGLNLYSEVKYLGIDAEWIALSPDQRMRLSRMPSFIGSGDQAKKAADWIALDYFRQAQLTEPKHGPGPS